MSRTIAMARLRRQRRIGPLALAAGLVLLAKAAAAAAAPCEDIDQPKCRVRLATGITMAYLDAGPASGRTILLLHGLTDSSRSWSLAMRALRRLEPGWRIVALDQRGHGNSSMPHASRCRAAPEKCFRMADFAGDVVAFMKAKAIAKATIVGHAMGSFVAQEVALSHPEMVHALVLVATATRGIDSRIARASVLDGPLEGSWRKAVEASGRGFPGGAYRLTPKDADPGVEAWLATSWDADPVADPGLVKAIMLETARVKLGTWIGTTRALRATDNSERLRSLSVPTLVIWGSQDSTFHAVPDQVEIRAALDAAVAAGRMSYVWKQYGVVPLPASGLQENDIGHNVQWDAPHEIAADIAAFAAGGKATPDLYRSDWPGDIGRIITEPGKATIMAKP